MQADRDDLLRLLDVARRLAAPVELSTLLGEIIDTGRQLLRVDRGTVWLYDPALRSIKMLKATGASDIQVSVDAPGFAAECARTKALVVETDCQNSPRFNRDVDRQTGYTTRALLSIPLLDPSGNLVGVQQWVNPDSGNFDTRAIDLAKALASTSAVALQRVELQREREARVKYERELDLARRIQVGLLPSTLPVVAGYDIATGFKPADQTGGDIFDLFPLPGDKLGVLIADATGHGISAALMIVQLKAMLGLCVRSGWNLDRAFTLLNDEVCRNVTAGKFITAFLGELDPQQHTLRYHSAGQAPLLHFHCDTHAVSEHAATTLPMGIEESAEPAVSQTFHMKPGDCVAVLTDGYHEYAGAGDELFGTPRVCELLRASQGGSKDFIRNITDAIKAFAGDAKQKDDMTGVVITRSIAQHA